MILCPFINSFALIWWWDNLLWQSYTVASSGHQSHRVNYWSISLLKFVLMAKRFYRRPYKNMLRLGTITAHVAYNVNKYITKNQSIQTYNDIIYYNAQLIMRKGELWMSLWRKRLRIFLITSVLYYSCCNKIQSEVYYKNKTTIYTKMGRMNVFLLYYPPIHSMNFHSYYNTARALQQCHSIVLF